MAFGCPGYGAVRRRALAPVTQATTRLAAALLAAGVVDAALRWGGCTLSLTLEAAGALRVPGDAHLAACKRRQALAPACGHYANSTAKSHSRLHTIWHDRH